MMNRYSNSMKLAISENAIGTSTDEDTDDEALHRAELNRARKLAQQRINQQEARERARAFAVLDNVSERESFSCPERRKKRRSKLLDPALNPHIDHEAVEAGDSDSDVQRENDSFIASDSSINTDNNIENRRRGVEDESGSHGNQHAPINEGDGPPKSVQFKREENSDASSSDQECVMYEEFAASREVVEAQIVAEERKRKRYMFCDSTDEDGSTKDHSIAEEETEEEASFSSVVGNNAEHNNYET